MCGVWGCNKDATVMVDGQPYCRGHDVVANEGRQQAATKVTPKPTAKKLTTKKKSPPPVPQQCPVDSCALLAEYTFDGAKYCHGHAHEKYKAARDDRFDRAEAAVAEKAGAKRPAKPTMGKAQEAHCRRIKKEVARLEGLAADQRSAAESAINESVVYRDAGDRTGAGMLALSANMFETKAIMYDTAALVMAELARVGGCDE